MNKDRISTLIQELQSTSQVHKLLLRFHSLNIEDVEQSLYLYWLENPASILHAQSSGYLLQYLTAACRNAAASSRRGVSLVPLATAPEPSDDPFV